MESIDSDYWQKCIRRMQRKVDFYIAEDSKTNVTVAEMEVAEMDIIESPVCPLFIEDEFINDSEIGTNILTSPQFESTLSVPTFSTKKYKPSKHFSDLDRSVILAEYGNHIMDVTQISKRYYINSRLLKIWLKKAGNKVPTKPKAEIIQKCISGNTSPAKLAEIYSVNAKTIRSWVKKSNCFLPHKYTNQVNTTFSKPDTNKCDKCGQSFSGKNAKRSLVNHLKTHEIVSEKLAIKQNYICQICNKTYKTQGLLNRHIKTSWKCVVQLQ